MGAESSVQRDGKSQEDASASASASASAGELSAEVNVLQEGDGVLDSKPLQKNGQISSMTSLNGHSEDNTLAEGANLYDVHVLESGRTVGVCGGMISGWTYSGSARGTYLVVLPKAFIMPVEGTSPFS